MEFVHTTRYTVTPLHADCFGRCKPSGLLRFAQDAAGEHCLKLGTDWDSMAAKHYFWAVIRQRMEISRLPEAGETVTVKTWPMPTTRVAYPRATEGFDEAGNSLFKIISIWVIMDMDSRTMVLPVKSGIDVAGTSFGTELKAPGGLPAGTFDLEHLRTVRLAFGKTAGQIHQLRILVMTGGGQSEPLIGNVKTMRGFRGAGIGNAAVTEGMGEFLAVGAVGVSHAADDAAKQGLQGFFITHDLPHSVGGRNAGQVAVVISVNGHFLIRIGKEIHNGFFRHTAVDLPCGIHGAFRSKVTGVEVERAFQAMLLHDIDQTDILLDAVIITEGKRFAETIGEPHPKICHGKITS